MNMPPERPFDTVHFFICEKVAKKNGGFKKGCLNYSGFQGNASVTRGVVTSSLKTGVNLALLGGSNGTPLFCYP